MVHTTMRSVAVLGSVGLVAVALAACSSSSGGSSSGGDTNSGAGKTLNVYIGNNTQFPAEQKAWFDSTSAKFKAQTGATVTWETFASANDELTKIQTSVVSGQGPDVYSLGTTFTPTAYATGAFVKLTDKEWTALGGQGQVRAGDAGDLGSGPEQPGRHPLRQPAVRHGLQQGPAQGGRHRQAGDHVGRAGRAGQEADHRRQLRAGDRLQGRLRPVEVRVGHVDPGR